MSITPEVKKLIIKDFAGDEKNTGAVEAQVGILSWRIENLQRHLEKNKKDMVAKRALTILISRRRRLLKYLLRKKADKAKEIMDILELRKI